MISCRTSAINSSISFHPKIALALPPDGNLPVIHLLLSDHQHIGNFCQLRIPDFLSYLLTAVIHLYTNIRIFQRYLKDFVHIPATYP